MVKQIVLISSFIIGLALGWPLYVLSIAWAEASFIDVCLKVTGTFSQAYASLWELKLDREMLRRDEDGNFKIATANHHVAVDVWMRPIVQFGTYDIEGKEIVAPMLSDKPILRIRFISEQAKKKAVDNITSVETLPSGLIRVPCPSTRKWAGG